MAKGSRPTTDGLKSSTPAPADFDALTATKRDLARHGLPERPDPHTQPGLAALWERAARRYRGFEHLGAALGPGDRPPLAPPPGGPFSLDPVESAGFELFTSAPITVFSGIWTVPDLNFRRGGIGPNQVRLFFGLGFLDLHTEMSVDSGQNVSAGFRIHTGATLGLGVRAGDVISAVLCLQTNTAGTGSYYVANETTGQTVNVTMDTGFPPAVKINAGISRDLSMGPAPMARFGRVYFDDLEAFTTSGTRDLVDGTAVSMTDLNGAILARTYRMTDSAFKIIDTGS